MTGPFQPWSRGGCTHPDCAREDTTTVDGHNGRRCAEHPPTFDPDRAVVLMVAAGPDTALAYVRAVP